MGHNGFDSLQESMNVLGVPVMSKQSFMQTAQQIGQEWWASLQESMQAAGREEKQHAIEQNRYHKGVPAISIIVDGGWSKPTHKHSYNAVWCWCNNWEAHWHWQTTLHWSKKQNYIFQLV